MRLILLFIPLVLWGQASHPPVNGDSAIIQDFEKRVNDYVQLRKGVEGKMPPLKSTASPERISKFQHELARKVREARAGAKAGDMFTPAIAAEMQRLVGISMKPDGEKISKSMKHAEPVQLRLRVNQVYPEGIPFQSMPPSLLANLPHLPEQLEYRVAGHDLILLDPKASLVIDVMGILCEKASSPCLS